VEGCCEPPVSVKGTEFLNLPSNFGSQERLCCMELGNLKSIQMKPIVVFMYNCGSVIQNYDSLL
jgi:hypothetical protein